MCFPDKITFVPAPLIQNTHRYQLAWGRRGACQSPPWAAGGISVCLWICVCMCVCLRFCVWVCVAADASFKTNKYVGINATLWLMTNDQDCLFDSYQYRKHVWLHEHGPSHLCCAVTMIKSLSALLAIGRKTQWPNGVSIRQSACRRRRSIRSDDNKVEVSDGFVTDMPLEMLPKQKPSRDTVRQRETRRQTKRGRHLSLWVCMWMISTSWLNADCHFSNSEADDRLLALWQHENYKGKEEKVEHAFYGQPGGEVHIWEILCPGIYACMCTRVQMCKNNAWTYALVYLTVHVRFPVCVYVHEHMTENRLVWPWRAWGSRNPEAAGASWQRSAPRQTTHCWGVLQACDAASPGADIWRLSVWQTGRTIQ